MRGRRKCQVHVGQSLQALVNKVDKNGRLSEARVVEEWNKVVGSHILSHTNNVSIRSGELLVSVDSAVWASELTAMSETLRTRINESIGKEVVKSIRFMVSKKVKEGLEGRMAQDLHTHRYVSKKVEPIPLTPEELKIIEQSVALIEKESLRTQVLRTTVVDLERKKGLERRSATKGDSCASE